MVLVTRGLIRSNDDKQGEIRLESMMAHDLVEALAIPAAIR